MDGCAQTGCSRPGSYLPVFVLYFAGATEPRRVEVPFAVCAEHAATIRQALASPARRADIEQATGRQVAIEWDRCRIEFVSARDAALLTGSTGWPS